MDLYLNAPSALRRLVRAAVLSLAATGLGALGGCNIIGGVMGNLMSHQEKPALYKPPQEPLLVLVENYQTAGMESTSDELAGIVIDQLKQHKVATVIEESKLVRLRETLGEKFASMPVAEIGRALGARQVLYIHLKEVQSQYIGPSDVMQGKIRTQVKVVDVETGRRMWPTNEDAYDVSKDTEYMPQSDTPNPNEMKHMLCENVGFRIARMFYSYKPEDESDVEQTTSDQ